LNASPKTDNQTADLLLLGNYQNKIMKVLSTFLENRGEYTNVHDVSIDVMSGDVVYIECIYPGFDNSNKYISLEIGVEYKTIAEFASSFFIHSLRDLENISPCLLLQYFGEGKMGLEVYCSIDDIYFGGSFRFRKNERGIFALDEDTDRYHAVWATLSNPDDFVNYTTSYFLECGNPPPERVEFSES
jgi:hypothetical protein